MAAVSYVMLVFSFVYLLGDILHSAALPIIEKGVLRGIKMLSYMLLKLEVNKIEEDSEF